MENSKKQKYSVKAVYLILMLVVATILIVTGIMLITGGKQKSPSPAPAVTGNVTPGTDAPAAIVTDPSQDVDVPPVTDRPADVQTGETTPSGKQENPPKPVSDPIHWSMPVSGIVSKSHDLTKQVFSVTMNDYRTHCGIDIQAPIGTAVCCVADGTVQQVTKDPFMGTTVTVSHAGGYISVYKNLNETVADGIRAGAAVKGGQTLGAVGETAIIEISDEPHLHLELQRDGNAVDPLSVLPYDPASQNYAE